MLPPPKPKLPRALKSSASKPPPALPPLGGLRAGCRQQRTLSHRCGPRSARSGWTCRAPRPGRRTCLSERQAHVPREPGRFPIASAVHAAEPATAAPAAAGSQVPTKSTCPSTVGSPRTGNPVPHQAAGLVDLSRDPGKGMSSGTASYNAPTTRPTAFRPLKAATSSVALSFFESYPPG